MTLPIFCLQGCGDSDGDSGQPKFLAEVGKDSYPETEAPHEAPLFRWDFSKPVVHAYDYTEKRESTADLGMGDGKSPEVNTDVIVGTLVIKSEGNGVATLVVKDASLTSKTDAEEETTMELDRPMLEIRGIKEDGNMKAANSSMELYSRFLSPLPPKPLRVGESVTVPAGMPFYAMGPILSLEGTCTITPTGYVTIDGRRCARLETDIDVSNLGAPEDVAGTRKCAFKGKSVSYFDVKGRRFVSLELALVTRMQMEGEELPAGFSEDRQIKVQTDRLVRFTLNPERTAAETKKQSGVDAPK